MQIWKLCVQVARAGAELCLGHLTSVSSPVLANKYHWPSAAPTWARILQRSLSLISLSFFYPLNCFKQMCPTRSLFRPNLFRDSATTTENFQQISLGRNRALDTTWAPCVPTARSVCWNGLVDGAVAFQHTQLSLGHFFFLIPPSESLSLKEHLPWERVL